MVRRATVGDAAAIAAVQARGWHHAFADIVEPDEMPVAGEKEPLWRAWLERDDLDVFVWDQAGTVFGFVVTGAVRDETATDGDDDATGELYAIYVEPAAQGAGVGRALLAAGVEALRRRGFLRAVLLVFEANGLARTFYERHGWAHDPGPAPGKHPTVRYRRALPPTTPAPAPAPPGAGTP
jgi:ribosomal protein S18 acetylase RimI-like enzyme